MANSSLDFQQKLQQFLTHPVKLCPIQDFVKSAGTCEGSSTRVGENSESCQSLGESSSGTCPFNCCTKELRKHYFDNCDVNNTTVKMRVGYENNKIIPHKMSTFTTSNLSMNYKQQRSSSLAQSDPGGNNNNSLLQRRTLFEGRVPGPMRFDELIKGQADYEDGDQEILLMERNNLKLTFHKGNNVQGGGGTVQEGQGNGHAGVHQLNSRQAYVERDRLNYGQYPFYPVTTLTDAASGGNISSTMSMRDSPPWNDTNHNHTNNFKTGNKWTNGQMDVTVANNVHPNSAMIQQRGHSLSQNQSMDCKIPVMEMKPYSTLHSNLTMYQQHHQHHQKSHTTDFIDQQLNSHLKSFKYIKPNQQQSQSPNIPPQANSCLNSATITKIPHPQHFRMPMDTSTPQIGGGNGNKAISTLNSKSKPNFKQKQQPQPPTSPRTALEYYEKLKKYWDYQHQILGFGGGDDYNNYSLDNPSAANNYNMQGHHHTGGYGQGKSHISLGVATYPYHQPPAPHTNWQYTQQSSGPQIRGHDQFDTGYNHNGPHSYPYQTNNGPQHKMNNPNSSAYNNNSIKTVSGFAAELEKLQNYHNYAHVQTSESAWTHKPTPATPAQKKTYYSSNNEGVQNYHQPCKTVDPNNKRPSVDSTTKEITLPRESIIIRELNHQKVLATAVHPPSPQKISTQKPTDTEEVMIFDCVDIAAKINHNGNAMISTMKKPLIKNPSPLKKVEVQNEKQALRQGSIQTGREKPTDLSFPRRRSDQDQRLLLQQRFGNRSPKVEIPQRPKSEGGIGITDVSGYDHIVLLDKRVMTYMCKRCLETLKSDQEIRNHLFCKMLQDSIQCHVCRNLLATEKYPEHLRGHGVRAFSN